MVNKISLRIVKILFLSYGAWTRSWSFEVIEYKQKIFDYSLWSSRSILRQDFYTNCHRIKGVVTLCYDSCNIWYNISYHCIYYSKQSIIFHLLITKMNKNRIIIIVKNNYNYDININLELIYIYIYNVWNIHT